VIILSTGSLYTYGLGRCFELARDTGFDGVEVLIDQRPDTYQARYLDRLREEYELPILALHSPFLPADSWGRSTSVHVQRSARLAQQLGVGVVVAHLPRRLSGILVRCMWRGGHRVVLPVPWGGDAEWLVFLREGLLSLEAETGVVIAVENMPVGRVGPFRLNGYWLNTPEDMASLPDITMDTTHVGTWGYDLLAFYKGLRDRVSHVHLSNFNGREHRLLGDGHLPLAELLQHLASDGYQGHISLETNPVNVGAEDEDRARARLSDSLAFCRQHLLGGSEQ
jgi:sugar phosphate isomerase/epimerase